MNNLKKFSLILCTLALICPLTLAVFAAGDTVQALHIEIDPSGERISSYYVYNCDDYVIDTNLPVWTGN